jgi:hypothetical protein
LLRANPDHRRYQPSWVDWTAIGDAAYNIPVHNMAGAPRWYAPQHNNAQNAELNRKAELARSVVEHQFGRIGKLFKTASDDAGPWHHFQGGHGHEADGGAGSRWGMAKSMIYFTVAARLTALTQRMRLTYPRDPDQFFAGEYQDWELASAILNVREWRRRQQQEA